MNKKSGTSKAAATKLVKTIRRKTRQPQQRIKWVLTALLARGSGTDVKLIELKSR